MDVERAEDRVDVDLESGLAFTRGLHSLNPNIPGEKSGGPVTADEVRDILAFHDNLAKTKKKGTK